MSDAHRIDAGTAVGDGQGRNSDHDRSRGESDHGTITRSEERLRVGREPVESGRVRVVTEETTGASPGPP